RWGGVGRGGIVGGGILVEAPLRHDGGPPRSRASVGCPRAARPDGASWTVGGRQRSDRLVAARASSARPTTSRDFARSARALHPVEENPACGQCAVTALPIRELLGGEIRVPNVLRH